MQKLTRQDLYPLEKYAEVRSEFRAGVMSHKKDRTFPLGPNAIVQFEDRKTIQYQVQEMLRVERIFEPEGIQEELDSYNPLIPDGDNWKATFMIEFPDPEERKKALTQLIGIEDRTYVKIGGFDPIYAIADEDLERETEEKTSSVHFLRFQLPSEQIKALKGGESLSIGCDHANYAHQIEVPDNMKKALIADLES